MTSGKIEKWKKEHPTILFWGKIFRRFSNPAFKKYVINFEIKDPIPAATESDHKIRHLEVHELGKKNPGRVVMLMNNELGHGGFCGLWIYYLNRLAFSERMGFSHVLNCVQSDFYQEDHPIHGTRNVYEYYFQQPYGISVKSAQKSQAVIFDYNCDDYGYFDSFRVGGEIDYTFKAEDINQFAQLQKQYIHLRPELEKDFKKQIEKLKNGKKVLAVHARGTDSKIAYKGHPLPITAQDYLETAKIQAEEIGADCIFLATDDESILKIFKDELGDKLLYYNDVIRSEGTVWNCYVEAKVKNPHYRLGYEIIRDVYTMAACEGFVCGMSYVSFIVQVVKKAKDEEFETFLRLFHGLRKDGLELTTDEARAEVRRRWAIELEIEKKREKAISENLDPDKVAPLPDWDHTYNNYNEGKNDSSRENEKKVNDLKKAEMFLNQQKIKENGRKDMDETAVAKSHI